jgi:hypothetical protein
MSARRSQRVHLPHWGREMPFPFLPAGAVIAASVLLAALTAFGLILRAMDRAVIGLRDNVLSGLVSGLRTWGSTRAERLAVVSPGSTTESPWGVPPERTSAAPAPSVTMETREAPELVDLDSRSIEPEPVRRR